MKNFPYGCSFLTPDFSLCSIPIPSKPLNLGATAALVLDKQGNFHFTQEVQSKRLCEETTFVPLNLSETLPKAPVIIAELPS